MLQNVKMMRTPLLIAAVIIVLGLLASACGSGETNKPAQSEKPDNSASGQVKDTEEQQKTRTVKDDLGQDVEIPVSPKRIIAGEFASELLALGVKPVGAGENGFKVVFTQNEMEGVERIGDPPNPEKILELNPDLIIVSTVFKDIYPEQMDQLSKVAPIFYISYDQDPIYNIFTKVADLVGKTEEAQDWIKAYEQESAAAREKLKASLGDETVSIFRVEKGRLRIYLNRNFAGYMLRSSLQAKAPAAVADEIVKDTNSSAIEISLEKLPDYAGDHLFVIVRSEGDDKGAFEEIEQTALWQNLKAVKNGNVHFLDTNKYYGSDVVTIRETMKEAVEMLSGAGGQ